MSRPNRFILSMIDCNTAAPNPLPQYNCFHHPLLKFFFNLGVFKEVMQSHQELPSNTKEDLDLVHSPNLSHLFHDTAEVLIAMPSCISNKYHPFALKIIYMNLQFTYSFLKDNALPGNTVQQLNTNKKCA